MSSFELLELFGVDILDDPDTKTRTIRVDFPPEDGALAEALRGGERPEWKQAIAQAANELAVIRVVQAPDAQADEYGSRLFLPPHRQRELMEEDERLRAEQIRLTAGGFDDGMASMWTQKEVS